MQTTVYLKVIVDHDLPCNPEELRQHVAEACCYGMEVAEPEGDLYDARIRTWSVAKGPKASEAVIDAGKALLLFAKQEAHREEAPDVAMLGLALLWAEDCVGLIDDPVAKMLHDQFESLVEEAKACVS